MLKLLGIIAKKMLPTSVIQPLRYKWFKFKTGYISVNQKKNLKEIKLKDKFIVSFFIIHESVWKYSKVYELFNNDPRFEVNVVVCPYVIYGDDNMYSTMDSVYKSFTKKGYNTIKTFDNNKWLDVKKEINPDFVFFTNPHDLTKKEYYFKNFEDRLTCYVPYNFGNSHLFVMMYDQNFHNQIWRLYAETEIHKSYSKKYARNLGDNVVVTGYPGVDCFIDETDDIVNTWKNNDRKKIIWAPHHTIDNDKAFLSYSSFLTYAEFFLELADIYSNKIQFAFKPHPLLINKLYSDEVWGEKKTNEYYKKWEELENCQLELTDYDGLFKYSDAMIHDSGSFIIEYLYTKKPVMFTINDDNVSSRMNSFGEMAFNQHYHANSKQDIIDFIDMVIKGEDCKKLDRDKFYADNLVPTNNISASKNIYIDILQQLDLP
ncbi:MAG: CDP-glycerol glycerophosphotransferase family protein [Ichthyobacteriaceae bacterium]|nr:CDP-glycerol glycerophosphotransferase family protein [Ichthyobacteriaceae bacterium]